MRKFSIEIKWGVIFSIVGLLWMFFEKSMGWHGEKIADHQSYTLFFFPIAVLIYIIALIEKRKSLDGKMSWKEGFISGILIGFVISMLAPLTQYITHNLISPDYFDNIINYAIQNPQGASEDQLKSYFTLGNYIKMAMIQAPIAGAITSAIISLFLKTN
jgi:hypothetical protein